MKWQFNQFKKEYVISKSTYGAVVRAGIVYDHNTNKRRKVEQYTLVKVVDFDISLKKIIVDFIKGAETFRADVDLDFLMSHCDITTPDANQVIQAAYVQHVAHNVLDKDTAIFIIVMTLTYLVGLIFGKGL